MSQMTSKWHENSQVKVLIQNYEWLLHLTWLVSLFIVLIVLHKKSKRAVDF